MMDPSLMRTLSIVEAHEEHTLTQKPLRTCIKNLELVTHSTHSFSETDAHTCTHMSSAIHMVAIYVHMHIHTYVHNAHTCKFYYRTSLAMHLDLKARCCLRVTICLEVTTNPRISASISLPYFSLANEKYPLWLGVDMLILLPNFTSQYVPNKFPLYCTSLFYIS